jgi:hypothetical protein
MTTPDDTATPETTRTTNETTDAPTTDTPTTDAPTTDTPTTDATSPPQIPGRTPITEEAGAPLVPMTRTDETERIATGRTTDTDPERFETPRRQGPPPTDATRDAPLVPDLRPTRRPRTDGGSR